jgi:hypothetical protein
MTAHVNVCAMSSVLYHAPHIPAGMEPFHWNPQEWHQNPQEWHRNPQEWIEVALEWTKIDNVAAKSLIKTLFQ